MACPHRLESFVIEEESKTVVLWSNSQRHVILTHEDLVRCLNAFEMSISVTRPSPEEVYERLRDLDQQCPIVDYSLRLVR